MKIDRKLLSTLLIADGGIVVLSALSGDPVVLLNTQVGFFSALAVMLGSMRGYRKMVDSRVAQAYVTADIDSDTIDRIEDPHGLYDEEEPKDIQEEEDIRTIVKAEKARLKASKKPLKETLVDAKGALSLSRIAGYLVLIGGFFFLHETDTLRLSAYLPALGVPPLTIAAYMAGIGRSEG